MKMVATFSKPLEGGVPRRLPRVRRTRPSSVRRPPSTVPPCRLPPSSRSGFSLLEILMAITVLIIIVLIISLVFQQTHTTWGVGLRRAGAETTLRSIMGIVEHDLTHAVDDTSFGGGLNNFPAPGASLPSIQFVALDGTNRFPYLVHYSFNGSDLFRDTHALKATAPATWSLDPACAWFPTPATCLNGAQPLNSFTFSVPAGVHPIGLPLRVEIEAHVVKNGTFAVVSGWSEGKNRPGHPEDRIVSSP